MLVLLLFSFGTTEITLCEPAHDNTYNKTGVASKDSDQSIKLPSMARVYVNPSLDSPEAADDTFDQRKLIRMRGCAG